MKTTDKDISKLRSRLSEEEESRLGMLIRQGDMKALNSLITANIGFVVSVARQNLNKGVPLEDLVSEGNIAMMTAARKWNPEKGIRFVQYAVWDIRKAINRIIAKQTGVAGGCDDVTKVSIDVPYKSGGLTTYADRIRAREDRNASENAYISSIGFGLAEGLKVLNERERQVITLFYGLGCDSFTMSEIGEQMSLRRERVRQIRKKAERKLRKRVNI